MAPNGGQNIKWMTAVSVWLFLAMTSALVTTKVSLLWILRLYKYEQIHPATWYVMMLVLLEVPLLCHVVHLVWNTPFINGSRIPLPRKSLILLGILGSVSESVAGAVFATEISYVLPEPVLLLLPAAVFTTHLILSTSANLNIKAASPTEASTLAAGDSASKKKQGGRPWQNCVCILMSSYLLWAPAAVGAVLHIWSSFNMKLGACLALPPALLVLSVTWSPHLQAAVARVKATGQGNVQKNSGLSLIYTLFRISTVPVTMYLVMFFRIDSFRHDSLSFLCYAIEDFKDLRVWLPVLLSCLFGFITVMIGALASKVALFNPGLRIPAFVTPMVSLGVAAVLWKDLESNAFWELSGSDVVSWTASGVAFVAWLIPFAIPGISVIRTPKELLRPFSDNFYSFSWRPFFLEQHLMLNTNVGSHGCDKSGGKGVDGTVSNTKNSTSGSGKMRRVYICTTMYRETELEMRRYLNSLKRAFTSEKMAEVEIETHIFMDNCVVDDQYVNPYAQQLFSLLCSVLNISPSALQYIGTPYGCQVQCRCLGGNQLFVHCKNGQEFKPKKRWSQVMYMHYILNHRANQLHYNLETTANNLTEKIATFRKAVTESCKQNNGDNGKYDHNNKIWFCSDQLLPLATSEALQRMFRDQPNSMSTNLPAVHGRCGEKMSDPPLPTSDESGSESAIGSSHDTGSEAWRENYAVSMQSGATSCSDTDDESDRFSFRSVPKVRAGKANSGQEERTVTSIEGSRHRMTGSSDFPSRAAEKKLRESDNIMHTPINILNDIGKEQSGNVTSVGGFVDILNSNSTNFSTANTMASKTLSPHYDPCDDVYILATDADTEFSGMSMRILLDQCEADQSLGAICGRTIPVGGLKPIVWYQKFEYAKDFWLVKSSQNVIGSVTCCPGCFSMYRGSALRDVMDTFSRPSESAYDTLVKDHGEDRWLCTLMMQKGWKLEYANTCRNSTHCPETCGEFLRQRRRWVLSELSNMLLIFQGLSNLIKGNATFSAMFVLSLLHMFVWVLLSPSTTLVVTCVAFHILYQLPMLWSAPVGYAVLLIYFTVCITQPRPRQRLVTQAIVAVMVVVMVAVSAGFVEYVVTSLRKDVEVGYVEFKPYFLVLVLIGSTIYAALLHASEGMTLCYGLVYAAIFPAMFLALPIYSIANMVDTSWGTRELVKTGPRGCCEVTMDDVEDNIDDGQFKINVKNLPTLSAGDTQQREEHHFWSTLKQTLLGCDVNRGESDRNLRRGLFLLRNRCVFTLFVINSLWYAIMTSVYVFANSDVVCYVIASLFSFALIVQLIGMTSYKVEEFLKRYIVGKMHSSDLFWVKEKS